MHVEALQWLSCIFARRLLTALQAVPHHATGTPRCDPVSPPLLRTIGPGQGRQSSPLEPSSLPGFLYQELAGATFLGVPILLGNSTLHNKRLARVWPSPNLSLSLSEERRIAAQLLIRCQLTSQQPASVRTSLHRAGKKPGPQTRPQA